MGTVWQEKCYVRPYQYTSGQILMGTIRVSWSWIGQHWVVVADTKSFTHTLPLPKCWDVLTRDTQ